MDGLYSGWHALCLHPAEILLYQLVSAMKHGFNLFFSLILLATFASSDALAQIRAEGSIAFGVGVPQGEFDDQLDAIGFGGQINGAIGLPGSPFLFGADLGFQIYGHERRNEPFSTTIPDVTVDVITDNSMFTGHLFVRLQPDLPVVRPYADALFGFKHLFTQTRIENEGFDEFEIARSTNFNDTALSYGFGGGLQFKIFSPTGEDAPGAVYLDVGAKYLIGTEASYLQEGSIRRNNGQVTFDVFQSKTTMLIAHFGVGVRF